MAIMTADEPEPEPADPLMTEAAAPLVTVSSTLRKGATAAGLAAACLAASPKGAALSNEVRDASAGFCGQKRNIQCGQR